MKIFDEELTRTDCITLGFILLQTGVLILNWSYLPTAELDTPYHLLMSKMFADYDTVMLWDYYEYAPVGRPNLYPPLEHILLWWVHDITGVDWWDIGRFVSLIQYPLPLFTVWFLCRKLFNPVTALASVVVLSVSYDFWFWQVSVAPTALIISLFPLFLYSFYRKKVFTSIVLLTAFMYLHLGLPYTVIFCVFIFSLFSLYQTREYMKQFAIVIGCSFLLFLPWIIHVLMYRDWLSSTPHGVLDVFSILAGINVLTGIFFAMGLFKCLQKAKTDLRYLLILSAFIGFLTVAFYGFRYKMHSPIINCVVAGIGFDTVYTRILATPTRKKVSAVFLLLLIPLGAFSLSLTSEMPLNPGRQPAQMLPNQPQNQQLPQLPPQNLLQNQRPQLQSQPAERLLPQQKPQKPEASSLKGLIRNPRLRILPSPLLEMLNSLRTGKRPLRMWQISNPEIDELIQWIVNNTSEDDILHLGNGMLADYLALFTDRRTDAGMYREVSSPELFKAVQEGRKSGIIIVEAEKFFEEGLPPGITVLERFGNVLVIQGMKPQLLPHEVPFHLEALFILLEHPDPQTVNLWVNTITEVRPQTIYVGIRQKDIGNSEVQRLIDKVAPLCEVRLAIIVEEKPLQNIELLHVTSVRLILPPSSISPKFVESVRASLDPGISLEVAILGPPIFENKNTVESLLQILPFVDRVVRHVSPNVESIYAAQKEHQLLGEKFFLQIDTFRGEITMTSQELYLLLQAAIEVAQSKVIIEFRYPPTTPELIDFLRRVYQIV